MSRRLSNFAEWIRTKPALRGAARLTVRAIPDVPWTRKFPDFGPLRFRLRQHRWFLWAEIGAKDHFMLGVFDRLIRPGDVVFDIGANIGVYTRMMAHWFGPSKMVAFEPMSQNVELLRANMTLGDLDDIVDVHALAVGDVDGEEALQVDDVRSTTAVLDRVADGEASAGRQHFNLPPMTERVRVARLDTLMAEANLPAPNVIKIDTEGAEGLVLSGARETLAAHKPRLAIATHGPDKVRATLEQLEPHGYFAYGYVDREDRRVWQRLTSDDAEALSDNNIIASVDEDDVRSPPERRAPEACRAKGDA